MTSPRAANEGLQPPETLGRGGGIRTHGLFVPNEARYQAAPHPAEATTAYRTVPSARQTRESAPPAGALELDERLGRAGRIESLGTDPPVGKVGVGVTVAAV